VVLPQWFSADFGVLLDCSQGNLPNEWIAYHLVGSASDYTGRSMGMQFGFLLTAIMG
jgi:hypothetical protein